MNDPKILFLIEEHYDETAFNIVNTFVPSNGCRVDYASYLWGNESLEFESNDKTSKVKIEMCRKVNLDDYKETIVIAGDAMDRLQYQAMLIAKSTSPTVEMLRTGVRKVDEKQSTIESICHSPWLLCADPELLVDRKVPSSHNIVCDVMNAGRPKIVQNGETVATHSDGLVSTERHPGGIEAFNQLFLNTIQSL